jgi:integrase
MKNKMKLTKQAVEGLPVRDTEYAVWDSEVGGFAVRVSPKGVRSYMVKYRVGAQQRRTRLGRHGPVTVDQARRRAKEILGRVASNEDPGLELVERRASPTVAELCNRFLTDHVAARRKPKTLRDYQLCVRRIVASPLGGMKVQDVQRRHIAELHFSLRQTPFLANRVVAVISKMFNLAEVWGLREEGRNPCRHIEKYKEPPKERFLEEGEFQRLWKTLRDLEVEQPLMRPAINAVRLLVLTGCRVSEIQKLRWEHVRETALELPDGKTGSRRVSLGPEAVAVLQSIERQPDNPFVITGRRPGAHLTDLERPWRRIRTRTGLSDVRLHDLRHSYASAALKSGEDLYMIGKLLGHKDLRSTLRYTHRADSAVLEAACRVGGFMASTIEPPVTPREQ